MIRDIYSRDVESPKYNDQTLEVSDALSQLIIKIENCLFTRKGDVLGSPGMGANLNDLIFKSSQIRCVSIKCEPNIYTSIN